MPFQKFAAYRVRQIVKGNPDVAFRTASNIHSPHHPPFLLKILIDIIWIWEIAVPTT